MSQYSLTVHVTDGNSTVSANVSVTLVDASTVGDLLVCTMETVQDEILEGISSSQIPLPTCFNSDGSVAVVSDLVYRISSGDPNALFEVTLTGFVSNVLPLDYEDRTVHTLVLNVQNSEMPARTATITVIVVVAPVNEFPPVLVSSPLLLTASEAARIGHTLGWVEALDMDGGRDGIITYSIVPPSSLIFVHPRSGSITLTNSLDYETTQVYNFTVLATDGSEDQSSSMTASTVLTIVVQDANDNPPTFSRGLYAASIREDSATGASVAMPTCSDVDVGVNSEVAYSITAGNDDGKFTINNDTGLISLAETLDYDSPTTPRFFSLSVRCRENQPPNAMAEALVLIELTSFNEFYPDPGNPRVVSITEDTQPGTRILQIQGRDRDLGLAGTLRYLLNENDSPMCPSSNLFMEESTGILYLMSAFDYEMGSGSYGCIVSVWDSERPIHIAETDIRITVGDVNDATPECNPSVSSVEVSEDSPPGTAVLTLACSDPDSRNLRYSFADSAVTEFQLRPGGEVRLSESLDFETQSLYVLRVQVSDGEFFTNTSIYVTVASSNEFPPVFSAANPVNCSLPENSLYGAPICTVQATDSDEGADGVVSYELATPSGMFDIAESTGQLYLVGEVDRELTNQIMLTVRATDGGTPSLSAETNITVVITDENDNSPQINSQILASISESSPAGLLVTTVLCTDADEAGLLNSDVSIQITSQIEELPNGVMSPMSAPVFSIDGATGEITTTAQLDFESVRLYRLSLVCRDGGTPSLDTVGTVHVRVEPVNEHAPAFLQTSYQTTIPEGTNVSTSILSVLATDADEGEDGEITYSIPGNASFWIDPQSGEILVVRELRCDLGTRRPLQVRASDGGQPPRETIVDVTIDIERCHAGMLTPSGSSVSAESLSENSPAGTLVLRASCTSSRAPSVVTPNYILTRASEVFKVDTMTGDVIVQSPPDYEQASSHLLHIRCFDPNHSNVSADMVAYISILPVNEYSPQFQQSSYTANVSESALPGHRVATVHASDLDVGSDGEVRYSVQDSSVVTVDPQSGEVYLAQRLDRESVDIHIIQITATDNPTDASSAQTDTVELTLNVLDSNDHWPVCERTVYHVYTSLLTTPLSTLLGSPNCSDADIEENSRLVYSLGDTTGKFSVSSSTGELSLVATLDPEDASTYHVPIRVRDSGATPLSVTLLVIVDLQQPPLELPTGNGLDQEYLSLVDAEGRKNSVNITLEDFSRPIVSTR